MQDHSRLYIAVRSDLSVGLAAAQAVHAAFSFATRHPSITGPWQRESQYLVIVTVPDEVALISLASNALARNLEVSTWHEPDLAGEATAVALEPGIAARRLCANLPLLGRELAVVKTA
jgi:peptidyl-tRNA hydrolase